MSERVALIALTKHGVQQAAALARQLPGAQLLIPDKFAELSGELNPPAQPYSGPLREQMARLFAGFDQLLFFVSLGAVVRLIAPHLKSKDQDPGVLVLDEAGQFVIPVLSGHIGGANAFAEKLAGLMGATAVLTTASDVGQTIAVDILGRELGWRLDAPKINVTRVSAAVVNEETVAVVQEAGSPHWWTRPCPLPANIRCFHRIADVDPQQFQALLWITHAEIKPEYWAQWHERLVVYRPPLDTLNSGLSVGLGCDRGTPLSTVWQALGAALASAGLSPTQLRVLASIEAKRDEAAFTELAALGGWPLRFFSAAELAAVPVPHPSATVLRHMGTPSVSAAAALLAAGARMSADQLLIEKFKHQGPDGKNATISIARIAHEHDAPSL
jgi:cobalt-precorrin 5A hydrolase